MESIYLCSNPSNISRVFSPEVQQALRAQAGLGKTVYSRDDVLQNPELFRSTRFIFSTWGMPAFSEAEIRRIFPALEAVFYAAGSVQGFAREFLRCGIKVFSAWGANAVPVAEYTVSQILLANKGFFASARYQSRGDVNAAREAASHYPGNYGEWVGIAGAGMIGKLVIQMLKNYRLNIKVADPFLSEQKAEELGVVKCSLEELFSTCAVVSNHTANNPQTQGIFRSSHFLSMRPWATFLNTGRGAQVVEADLADALERRPDLTAVLDVTWPEPPEKGHPFYRLPNCILTPHIAGSSGTEVCRMAEYMLQEFQSFAAGRPCRYEVTEKKLETMA